ncbi:MAG TPA: phosphatase PAP2 family protein [Bacteroidales bacterium]
MEFLQSIDQKLFLFLNGLHCSALDGFMWQVSTKTLWIPFYAVLIFFMVWKRKKYWWITILSIALMILLSDQGADLVKNTVHRPRPTHTPAIENMVHVLKAPDGREYRGGSYGFVSSHASNCFAVAFFVSLFFARRWLTIVMFCWAVLVCYSRIYLGVHYPGDILGGVIIGSAVGIGMFYLERFVYRKIQARKS